MPNMHGASPDLLVSSNMNTPSDRHYRSAHVLAPRTYSPLWPPAEIVPVSPNRAAGCSNRILMQVDAAEMVSALL